MDNLNDKLSNEAQSQPSCLGAVSNWVAVKDKLPPVELDVLVWDEFSIYISNRLDVEGIVWDESIHILDNVTYWMHLPKPPCC